MTAKKSLIIAAALLGGLLILFFAAPAPVDPLPFEPEAPPELQGAFAPNTALRSTELLAEGEVRGPEDIAVDARGRIYGANEDGTIVRLDHEGGNLETFANTGGRPLGLAWGADGRLLVADAAKGLLAIDASGVIETLSTEADGVPFRFTDDLDVASDGKVYFSDASSRFDHHHYLHDLLEARPWGRLLVYDPADGSTTMLLDDLYFANGIALSENEDFVLVNETYRYRITRYWLTGPKAGTSDIFIDNLPGFADGVSANRRGTFWVALFTVRNPTVDRLHPSPFLKRTIAKLPKFLWPKPAPYGLVMALDESGRIVRTLHDPGGQVVQGITSVEEVDGHLYFGNLYWDWIGRWKL